MFHHQQSWIFFCLLFNDQTLQIGRMKCEAKNNDYFQVVHYLPTTIIRQDHPTGHCPPDFAKLCPKVSVHKPYP